MSFNFLESILKDFKDLNNEYKNRVEICNVCEERNEGICNKCGCFLSVKTMLPTAKCPLNKW